MYEIAINKIKLFNLVSLALADSRLSPLFEDKAIEKLLGTDINSEYLNHDKIGRLMDNIYQLGLTNLFIELALLVIKKFKIETINAHLDSTSFHYLNS